MAWWSFTLAVCLIILLLGDAAMGPAHARQPSGQMHGPGGIGPGTLGVIVNDRDPLSLEIGAYYARRRGIPPDNIIHVSVDPGRTTLGAKEFATLKAGIDRRTPGHIEAYALTWIRPYRVECMSITAALALGFDAAYCGEGCATTPPSLYFNSRSARPYVDFRIRPVMSLAAVDFDHARDLIDRGIAADGSHPRGTAYLVTTDDAARNVRAALYRDARLLAGKALRVEELPAAGMHDKHDVLFYFTGSVQVDGLGTHRFLPGAIADHLTSFGGQLDGRKQMSSLRWLEAGATASYGTVVEPCNITAKFPNPGILMHRYLAGDTVIEAYWKSVLMPAQGLFIGEPLASPYRLIHH